MADYADILKCDMFIQSFTTRQHCTSNSTVISSFHTLTAVIQNTQEAKLSLG